MVLVKTPEREARGRGSILNRSAPSVGIVPCLDRSLAPHRNQPNSEKALT